jgi:hypothetical protein
MENNVRIRKIPLLPLLDTLSDIHRRGVDFVDVYGKLEDGQDTIQIIFCKAYMDPNYVENFETIGEEEHFPSKVEIRKLSDGDLNELI